MAEGIAEAKRFVSEKVEAALASSGPVLRAGEDLPVRTGPLLIAVPIYNHSRALSDCLEAMLPTLAAGDQVWLLDDASEDPGVRAVMDSFAARWPDTRMVHNPANLGFVENANQALRQALLTSTDVVLLNSDAVPQPGWLEQLQGVFERNPKAGIACPLSDRATLLSVDFDQPPGITASASTAGDVPLPTAVGFCMLIRHEMLRMTGPFSLAFSPGYGEENDLSMRALKSGWEIIAADRAFVRHRSGVSFGAERAQLQQKHQMLLDRIWPEYTPMVQAWWRDNPLRARQEQLAGGDRLKPSIVHVLHRQYQVGGTERVTRDLVRQLQGDYRHSLLYPGDTDNAWCDFETREPEAGRELMLNRRWIEPGVKLAGFAADLSCPQSERALARVLRGNGPGIVHFHHMLQWDSLALPSLARALGNRVVISVHDLWFNCAIHNQLEYATGQPCGRDRARPDQRCSDCLRQWADTGLPDDKAARRYIEARHQLLAESLDQADAILVPSEFIRDKLINAFPGLDRDRLKTLPHGVPLPKVRPNPETIDVNRPIVGFFAGDQNMKGAGLVLEIAQAPGFENVRFHVWGRDKDFDRARLPANVSLKGFYAPGDVSRAMSGVALTLVPSFYEESFSLVVSECWAHGIPVLASMRGALPERIQEGKNGWLVDDMAPESWVAALRHCLEADRLVRCREELASLETTSSEQSAQAISEIYQQLLDHDSPPIRDVQQPIAAPHFQRQLESFRASPGARPSSSGQHMLGIVRDHWGTAQYRVRFPLQDLASGPNRKAGFHVIKDSGFDVLEALQRSGAQSVAVQPFPSDEGLRMMERLHRESGLHLTLVIDDLWTELADDNPVRRLVPDDIGARLQYLCSLSHSLVLTCDELKQRLGVSHPDIHVINNALPESPWVGLATPSRNTGRKLRIGWPGAGQHAADLAFLEPVIRATRDLADWVFLGMCPNALRPLVHSFLPMVPFADYPAALAGLDLDLAIAPLTDSPFNRCKSHLKVLECGILGIPLVAADLHPYRHCPVPLARPDDADDWIRHIRHLLTSREDREELGRSLQQWVLGNHLSQHRRAQWEQAMGFDHEAR